MTLSYKAIYIAVMLGIALGGVFAFVQLDFTAAAFAGMAFFAWTHAYNLRFPVTSRDERTVLALAAAHLWSCVKTLKERKHPLAEEAEVLSFRLNGQLANYFSKTTNTKLNQKDDR